MKCVVDLRVGYDGIEEFVPALMELIQSKLDGSRGKDSERNVVKLERASAFYHPPIRETVKGSHAVPAAKAEVLLKKPKFAEDDVKLSNGSTTSPPPYSCASAPDSSHYAEPLTAIYSGHDIQSHLNGDASNGIT